MNTARLIAWAAIAFISYQTYGEVLYVDDDAAAGGDGRTWTTAFRHLQDALTTADLDAAITEIHVAGGVYYPDRDESGVYLLGSTAAFFHIRDDLAIFGGYRGLDDVDDPNDRDTDLFETILSGDLGDNDEPFFVNRSDNSRTIISTSGAVGARLDGLTLTGAFDSIGGGALQNTNGAPLICNCVFKDNHGAWGGAISSSGDGRLTLLECNFINNRASSGGGAAFFQGNADVINCRFLGNLSYRGGGAIQSTASVLCANSIFIGNRAGFAHDDCDAQPWALGGAIYQSEGELNAVNCVFTYNFAVETGGGIFLENVDDSRISNCIFYLNHRCDGLHNFGGIYSNYSMRYCCIDTNWPGEHLINVDPHFARIPSPGNDQVWGTIDDDYGEVRLMSDSNCIDAGENALAPVDTHDLDMDGDTEEPMPIDAEGRLRFTDLLSSPDTGAGSPPIIDMGAYEYQCVGDLNGDGVITLPDLAILLANYGEAERVLYQKGDLDGNQAVDLADLAALLSFYGQECQ